MAPTPPSSFGGSPGSVLLALPRSQEPTTAQRARAFVFQDPRSRALQARIERFAPSEATVLITGETGTGKEIVARYVHQLSRRAAGPFLAVNCAALPESLIEAELFGYVRGAFTGAAQDKAGWFEAGQGGTLFLDEIGDLSPQLQVKLLRVLQEREVVRLGSQRTVPVDVRLIAATNVAIEEAVAAGRFRADLYYRLDVARIAVDPLRDRPGDVLPLARHFIDRYAAGTAAEVDGAPPSLTPEAERALLRHPWGGNIRELENAVHHALLVCRGGRIEPEDLPLAVLPSTPGQRAAGPAAAASAAREGAREALARALRSLYEERPPELWKEIEETVFRTAYEHAGLNQLRTARLLGLTRSIVRARLLACGALPPPGGERRLAPVPARRVLVVEDDGAIRGALANLFQDEGYEVSLAENGREALDVLSATRAPDVILLDLMMPVMDGWQFRAIQRDDPNLRAIPVVVMTAHDPRDPQALGARAYLRKPCAGAALLRAVEESWAQSDSPQAAGASGRPVARTS